MVLNLKDKEENLSGKGFNWSWFGLNDNDGITESKIFRQLSKDVLEFGINSEQVDKQLLKLSNTSQELALGIATSGKPVTEISQGFLAASRSASKMTIASKAAAAGMKILSVAGNMLFSIGIGIALNLITEGISAIANAQQNAIDKSNELIGAWKEQRDTLESNKKSIDTISGEQNKSIVHIQLDWLDMESAFAL